MEHDNRQRGEPELSEICPGCGAPDRFSCTCSGRRVPLGKDPYTVRISHEELEIAIHHRAATGEPIQAFVRRLIRQSTEARSLRHLMACLDVDTPTNRPEFGARGGGKVTGWDHRRGSCLPSEPEPHSDRETI